MHTCIYTRTNFASSTGEHILQNFLGARWTSNSIVCNEAQIKFGKTIDSAFEVGRPLPAVVIPSQLFYAREN